MAGIVALVAAISADVVSRLASGGYPALDQGKILLGRQHVMEHGEANRIVFIPIASRYAAKDPGVVGDGGYAVQPANVRLQAQRPSIATEWKVFEVHVWGTAVPAEPDNDFDATEVLHHAILQTCDRISRGRWSATDGKWDQGTQLVRYGRYYIFKLALDTPILGELPALQPEHPGAPSDVRQDGTVQIDIGDGTPEVAATGI